MEYNIPDVHPAAVISAFHQNVRNRKVREELAMNKVKDVAELYVLADRCAWAEEGRKYLGEDAGAETDSTDEDTPAPTKKGRRRNRKRKGKTVLAVEGSDNTGEGLGGPRTAGLYTLAGLLDYEDTRLKTLSRVRVGLSFAWKASLAIQICRFPSL